MMLKPLVFSKLIMVTKFVATIEGAVFNQVNTLHYICHLYVHLMLILYVHVLCHVLIVT